MKENENYLVLSEEEKLEVFIIKVKALQTLFNKPIEYIIEKILTTHFAKGLKPRLKDYQTIYIDKGKDITGNASRFAMKGKNPWKDGTHGMTNNLRTVEDNLGFDFVAENVVEAAATLVETTINEIFSSRNRTQINRYKQAIPQSDFIYMMLQIAVKLIGIDLYNNEVIPRNSTLKYMTQMIEQDKKRIVDLFQQSIINTGTINEAVDEYYAILEKYFDDFLKSKHLISIEEAMKIGEESLILKTVGEENILFYIEFLIENIQKRLMYNTLLNEELITVK